MLRKLLSYWYWQEHVSLGKYLLRWILWIIPVSAVTGSACALFLWSLEQVTQLRWANGWLFYLLPLAGMVVGWVYHRYGKEIEGGNNLIVDEIHEPSSGVPLRMAPLVFIATIVSHLFGASVGREGTAVQMGGSIASKFGTLFGLDPASRRTMLMVGIAAGFGAVFGTPLAGALFAVEVLTIGKIEYDALIPTLIASILGDLSCRVWGIHHTTYAIAHALVGNSGTSVLSFEWLLLIQVIAAGIVFGLASVFFAELTHGLGSFFKQRIRSPLIRPVVGGFILIGVVALLGTRDYLGLGVSTADGAGVSILSSFHSGGATPFSWLWKIIFTALSLSTGFKGGEVTPLFFIGSTLGNALSGLMVAPTELFAALGFVAVFAGATNTPLACTVMSVELFGSEYFLYFAVACYVAYFFSGHSGIYLSQRVGVSKGGLMELPDESSLRSIRSHKSTRRAKKVHE